MCAAPAPARRLAALAARTPAAPPGSPGPWPGPPGAAGRLLLLVLLLWCTSAMTGQGLGPQAGGSPLHHDDYDDEDGPSPAEGHDQEYDGNHTEVVPLGATLGGPCTNSCSPLLQNVRCSRTTHRCECHNLFPVEVSPTRGCTAPVGLGEQCLYQAACQHWDAHSHCTQVEHNAVCQCEPGFHTVAVHKQGRRSFCSEDLVLLTADLPTLLGVATGIALFTGVICFVLRLFVGGRPRDHFANANLAPSHILFSSDTGSEMSLRQLTAGKMAISLCRAGPPRLPLTGRSTSRSGSQRSVSGSLSRGHGGHGGLGHGQGGLGSSSRAGAARAAAMVLMSCGQAAHAPTHATHAPIDDKETDDDLDDDEDVEDEDEDEDEDDRDVDDCPPPVPTSTPPPLTPVEPKPPASSPLTPPGSAAPAPGTAPQSAPTSCSASPRGSPTHQPQQAQQAQRARGGLGQGSRRQSTASVHSSASSTKSMGFGMRRYEREREQRLRRQQQLQNPGQGQGQQGPSSQGTAGAAPCPPSSLAGLSGLAALGGLQTPGSACSAGNDELGLGGRSSRGASPSPGPSPNPLSPMSTDKLLPALDQLVEDVVWTTQSSSQRQDNVVAGQAGPSGYRPLHVQRAEMRSERARHLHAQLHSAQLHAGHLQQQTGHGGHVQAFPFRGNGGALAGLALSAAGPSSASAGAAGPSTSASSAGTSPDGR